MAKSGAVAEEKQETNFILAVTFTKDSQQQRGIMGCTYTAASLRKMAQEELDLGPHATFSDIARAIKEKQGFRLFQEVV